MTKILTAFFWLMQTLNPRWASFQASSDGNPWVTDEGLYIEVCADGSCSGAFNLALSSSTCLELSATSGTAPATIANGLAPMVRMKPTCSGSAGIGVTSTSYTVTISGAEARVVTIPVNVIRATPLAPFSGYNQASSATYAGLCSGLYRLNYQICPYTPTKPGAYVIPAVGGTITDVIFGTPAKLLAQNDYFIYPNRQSINWGENLMITQIGILRLSDGVYEKTFSAPEQSAAYLWFPEEGSNPRLYSIADAGTTVTVYTRSGSTLTLQTTYNCGIGTQNAWFNTASKEGWIAVSNAANTQACVINLNTGEMIVAPLVHPGGVGGRDNLYISKGRDKVTGLHYLWYGGDPGVVYAFKSGDTSFTPIAPDGFNKIFNDSGYGTFGAWGFRCTATMAAAGWCVGQDHVDTVEIDGEQALVTQNGWVLRFNRFMSDLNGMREAQRGLQIDTNGFPMSHVGCGVFVPFCGGYTRASLSQTSSRVSSVTGAAPVTVNLNVGLTTVVNGDTVQITGAPASACPELNGTFTIANLNGPKTSFEIPITCSTGYATAACPSPFAASTCGAVVTKTQWTGTNNDANRATLYKLSFSRSQISYGDHRSLWFTNHYVIDYFFQPWTAISPKGKYIYWKSNLGIPDKSHILLAEVNQTAPGTEWLTGNSQVKVAPTTTTAVFTWHKDGTRISGCTIEVASNPQFVSPATTTAVSLVGNEYTSTASGLTTKSQYYYRVLCKNNYFNASNTFTTR